MEGTAFFPLSEGLRMTEIHREEAALTVKVLSERASARCPLCGEESAEAHSRDLRRLKDMPSIGQTVQLHLTVRKFFCRNPACQRQIFDSKAACFRGAMGADDASFEAGHSSYWPVYIWKSGNSTGCSPRHCYLVDDHSSTHHAVAA